MKLPVTSVQRFCIHDGPGIRTTVFLKGCPLRCRWCHNIETQSTRQQIYFYPNRCIGCRACTICPSGAQIFSAGGIHELNRKRCRACGQCVDACPAGGLQKSYRNMNISEILELVEKDRAFYEKNGGLTISGGEPMLHPLETLELLHQAKRAGLNTAVETCGYFDAEFLEKLCRYADLLLWDLKDTDDARHMLNTGVSNKKIIENLYLADRLGARIILRCIILRGINDNAEHLAEISRIFQSLRFCEKVIFLPCHSLGGSKARALGLKQENVEEWVPGKELMEWVSSYASWSKQLG